MGLLNLIIAKYEIDCSKKFDYIVINNVLEETVNKICEIITD